MHRTPAGKGRATSSLSEECSLKHRIASRSRSEWHIRLNTERTCRRSSVLLGISIFLRSATKFAQALRRALSSKRSAGAAVTNTAGFRDKFSSKRGRRKTVSRQIILQEFALSRRGYAASGKWTIASTTGSLVEESPNCGLNDLTRNPGADARRRYQAHKGSASLDATPGNQGPRLRSMPVQIAG
jgi:hypothetical protein